jgi:hypothetical protein
MLRPVTDDGNNPNSEHCQCPGPECGHPQPARACGNPEKDGKQLFELMKELQDQA